MKKTAVYTITSGLHDEASVSKLSDEFLAGIFPEGDFDFKGADFSDFGSHPLDLIYVRTGGAEGIFRSLFPTLLKSGAGSFHLLTSGKSNSLAASLEILSWLRQQGYPGEVLHGSEEYLQERIGVLAKVGEARRRLSGQRIGVVGKPSDWLISSDADPRAVRTRLGVAIEDIPMEELLAAIADGAPAAPGAPSAATAPPAGDGGVTSAPSGREIPAPAPGTAQKVRDAFPGAVRIHDALRSLVSRHRLDALTLRCFDLLGSVGNTGCLALAALNSSGIPASCEGDVPALLSMMIAHALTGVTGFQANPARIDIQTGEMLFAHCTIPFGMVSDWQYDTHFESGIGVGIHGHFPEGPVTVFKVSGDLGRYFVSEGELTANQYEDNLCRTQVVLRLPPEDAGYFLKDPIGNHHIILPGHWKNLLEEFMAR